MTSHPVFLKERATGRIVDAELVDAINDSHLDAVENDWMPHVMARIRELLDNGVRPAGWPQSWHWNWREKVARIKGLLAFQTYALLCEGQVQGLMQINSARGLCRLPEQAGKHLAYIDYVETAPWNRSTMTSDPRYKGVGVTMMNAAIQFSRKQGFHGRIGLHSLPQSEGFYENFGMIDLGIDGTYENLKYFEMTSAAADKRLK